MRARVWTRWLLGLVAVVCAGTLLTGQTETPAKPVTPTIAPDKAAGHRLWVFVFDVSSMASLDAARARLAASRWIDESLGPNDLVAIVSIGVQLQTIQNFTTDPARVRSAVNHVSVPPASDGEEGPVDERDYFNNDLRFRGLQAICSALQPIPERKAIIFFTAFKLRPGTDNQAEIRGATNACSQANTSINPVDVGPTRIGG